jgi:hypothetical protein
MQIHFTAKILFENDKKPSENHNRENVPYSDSIVVIKVFKKQIQKSKKTYKNFAEKFHGTVRGEAYTVLKANLIGRKSKQTCVCFQ